MLKRLGSTDIFCSELILGCDRFGGATSKEDAYCFMDYYFENGGNTLDTARLYSGGNSEIVIGDYLMSRGIRQKVVISTKCAHPLLEKMNESRLSQKEIFNDVDRSLEALRIDCIDILWLHRDDTCIRCGEIIDTMNMLVNQGKIKCFGASNWSTQRIIQANEYAQKHGKIGFCASQIQWAAAKAVSNSDPTLVSMTNDEFDVYSRMKLPVFAYSSQAKGFFEKYDKNILSEELKNQYLCEDNKRMYSEIKRISVETGYSISKIALSYLTKNSKFDTFPIINCSKLHQLEDSVKASEINEKLIEITF